MHRMGHVGMNLLVYAPLAFGLAWLGLFTPLVAGLAVVVLLSTFPDIDLYVSALHHRGLTHTVKFAVMVGVLLGGAGALVAYLGYGTQAGLTVERVHRSHASVVAGGMFGFSVGALGVVGHLIGDAFTPQGITPLEPYSDYRFTFDAFDADSGLANGLWLGAGIVLLGLAVVVGSLLGTGVLVVRPSGF